eukprot:SAG31_NODE_9112_length_1332_cov_1.209246_1_plen_172_part_00
MKAFSLTVLFVLGGGACAAAGAVATNFTADGAAASWIKQLGVSCLSAGGAGAGDIAGDISEYITPAGVETLFRSQSSECGGYYCILTGAGAAAPDYSHFYGFPLDGYVYSDLLQGSGGEKINGTPPFLAALGRALAQPFSFLGISIRCDSALRTSGGGGVARRNASPAPLP